MQFHTLLYIYKQLSKKLESRHLSHGMSSTTGVAKLWRMRLKVAHCNLVVITRSLQPRINLCFCKQTRHGREILAPGFMEIVAHLKPYNKKLTHGR